jgi:hypothetical protein
MNRLLCACVASALGLAEARPCEGAVVNEHLYRLGEADVPAAVALGPGDNPTVDSGTIPANAAKVGLTFYHAKGSPPVLQGLVSGSTVAMEFTNIDSRYVAAAALSGVTENFGMEVYIQVSAGVAEARAFYNGGDGTPFAVLTSGYGLGIHGGKYAAIVGGAVFPTPVAAVPGAPVAIALVNTGGGHFDVYVQKLLVSSFVAPVVPPLATEMLSMGNVVGNQSPPAFAGVLDEARVFTFVPGGFDPKTDLGAAAAITLAGTPGQPNCHGKSISALARQFGGLPAAATAMGLTSVPELQDAVRAFCQE